jgi:hypothetical protein
MKNTNKYSLLVGDSISFVNKAGGLIKREITRIEEKSCYLNNGRNSWSTVNSYFEKYKVKIERAK